MRVCNSCKVTFPFDIQFDNWYSNVLTIPGIV
nr:MAG TPA_asm: tax1-binding protein [Bacteriophage sp.]